MPIVKNKQTENMMKTQKVRRMTGAGYGHQVAFIEELQRRLAPADFGGKSGAYLPISQSSPNLAAAAAAAEAAAQHHHHQQQTGGDHGAPFELRALEVALDVVSQG